MTNRERRELIGDVIATVISQRRDVRAELRRERRYKSPKRTIFKLMIRIEVLGKVIQHLRERTKEYA